MLNPIGSIPIGNEPVRLLSAERIGADLLRLTLQRERTYVLVGTRSGKPAWVPLAEKRRVASIQQTEQRSRTYTRVVTALGWAAIPRELVAVE